MKKKATGMHEEWFVGVQQKGAVERGESQYINVMMWQPGSKINDRYFKTREEAEAALARAYMIWNDEKQYNAKGERYEQHGSGVFAPVVVCTKDTDDRMSIVKHIIKKRLVTDWEVIEK